MAHFKIKGDSQVNAITMIDLFENTVDQYPDRTAVIQEDRSLTYAELHDQSVNLGISLKNQLNGSLRTPISVFIDKSIECLITMLGILYSGNLYVPMDVKTPIERLNSILSTLESDRIICTGKEEEVLRKSGYSGDLLLYEELTAFSSAPEADSLRDIRDQMVDTDLMYILFTSGSTGIPKGVAIRHRSVLDYVYAFLEDTGISKDDVLGNQTPFYADMSLKDICMAFATGAAICIIPQTYFMSPKKLLRYLKENQVTSIAWVPTAYRLVSQFDALKSVQPDRLKRFIFSGESMPISTFMYWKEHYPNGVFIQNYGPTEITGACTTYHITEDRMESETIPIGHPYRNTGILLLDENEQLIRPDSPGIPGEICVYGTCLAAGYYNNPGKTSEVFVQNPLYPGTDTKMYRTGDLAKWNDDGNLVFISRKDYQIKHGGKRIELGEIEAAVDEIDEVGMCCAVHNRGADELVLCYCGDIDKDTIRDRIKNKLPKYMIPTKYLKLDALPLLPNGKLDRKKMDHWANE